MAEGNIAEKQALLESLEKQIKTKQTELSSTRLEIKSKVKLLEDLNEIANAKDDNVLLTKLQTQQEMLLISDKQVHALQQNIETLMATRIDPQVLKEKEEKIVELVAQIADLQAELLEAMNENNALKSKNYEEEINVSKLKLQFQEKEKKLVSEIEALKLKAENLNSSFENIQRELEEVTAKRDKYRDKKKQYKAEIKELQEKISTLMEKETKVETGEVQDADEQQTDEIQVENSENAGSRNDIHTIQEKEKEKVKAQDSSLLEELECQMQAVSDLHRANMRLQEELDIAVQKLRKAKQKSKHYKQMHMEGRDTENQSEAVNKAGNPLQHNASEDEAGGDEQNKGLITVVEAPKFQFSAGEPNQELKEMVEKLRQKQESDRQKKQKYKQLLRELKEQNDEQVKSKALTQDNEKTERDQAFAQLTKQLEKAKIELELYEEKHQKTKKKAKQYKDEQEKWKERYRKVPKKHRELLSDEEVSDKGNETPKEDWNKREQIFKTQTDEYTRTLELKEVEIDELKKQLAQINDEHSSSAKAATEEISQLKQQLDEAKAIGKKYEECLEEKDALINELEQNISKLEELNKELEEHVEEVDDQIEVANTQMLELQQQLHLKEQEYSEILAKNKEYIEQKMKQAASKITVMADTLQIKEESLKKKEEFTTRLVDEVEKLKKKLNAANNKIQYELKSQITDAEKKLKDKDIEIKILKDMIQSTKTMLRVRDNEVTRLQHKHHVSEAAGSNQENRDHNDKELDPQISMHTPSTHMPRGYYRSADSRIYRSSPTLPGMSQQRIESLKYLNADAEASIHTPYLHTDGVADERQTHVRKRSDFLPSIDKNGQRDHSFLKHRGMPESISNLNSKGTSVSTSKLQHFSIKEQELRQILDQANDENKQHLRSVKSNLKASHHNVFDPSDQSDYKTDETHMQIHISPARVTRKKKDNF